MICKQDKEYIFIMYHFYCRSDQHISKYRSFTGRRPLAQYRMDTGTGRHRKAVV